MIASERIETICWVCGDETEESISLSSMFLTMIFWDDPPRYSVHWIDPSEEEMATSFPTSVSMRKIFLNPKELCRVSLMA